MKRKLTAIFLAMALIMSMFSITACAGSEVSYRHIDYSTTLTPGASATGTMNALTTPVAITGDSVGAAKGFTVTLEEGEEYLLTFLAQTSVPVPHVINIMVLNNSMEGVFSKDILSDPVVFHCAGTKALTSVRFEAPSDGKFRVLITEGSLTADDYKLFPVDYSVNVEKFEPVHYDIATLADLNSLVAKVNSFEIASAKLDVDVTADIPFGNENWTGFKVFAGDFDGGNYTLSNFGMGTGSVNYGGVFGQVMGGATISNVKISGIYSLGAAFVGSLAGSVEYAEIKNCSAEGKVEGVATVGGLIGSVVEAEITDCSSACTVIGVAGIGGGVVGGFAGLAGINADFANCAASGTVSGALSCGGFVGSALTDSSFDKCSATGNATAVGSDAGGFVGTAAGASFITCTASGSASGINNIGGFIGSVASDTEIKYSEASGAATGTSNVGGFAGLSLLTGSFDECAAKGNVCGRTNAGGFIGSLTKSSSIINSYATGAVTAPEEGVIVKNTNFGGFIGYLASIDNTVTNCYTISPITVEGNVVGGFIGGCAQVSRASFKNCYTASAITITGDYLNYGTFMGMPSKSADFYSPAENCFASSADISVYGATVSAPPVCNGYTSLLPELKVTPVDFKNADAVASMTKTLNELHAESEDYDSWSGSNASCGPNLDFVGAPDGDDKPGENVNFFVRIIMAIVSFFRNLIKGF